MEFKKWQSIDKFSDIHKSACYHHDHKGTDASAVKFRAKIKLHGANASIMFSDGVMTGQKRSGILSDDDTHYGFKPWLSTVKHDTASEDMIFYGEWAGPGVQKKDAVTKIGGKKFFIFAVRKNDSVIVEPEQIETLVKQVFGTHPDIHVLPWHTDEILIDFTNTGSAQDFITGMNALVNDVIGIEDPYISNTFGVSGPGEGLVFYPVGNDHMGSEFIFKIKTDIHSVNKSKTRNHIAPEKPENMDEFIWMFFTEQRFEQMLGEHFNGTAERRNTGEFIKLVLRDIEKESRNEIELAEFDWNQVKTYGVVPVRDWFLNKTQVLPSLSTQEETGLSI